MLDFTNMIPIAEYAKKVGKTTLQIADKCRRGTIKGAVKFGRDWFVPEDAEYFDHRITSGNYIGTRRKRKEKQR